MTLTLFLTSGDDPALFLEVVRLAEARGFSAVWIAQGTGLFLNPALLAAAAAVATRKISIRGHLALPLHSAIRVAEEWALVDNLSGGRTGLSVEESPDLETVRRLWRGEAIQVPNGLGQPVEIRILPQPIQPELPLFSVEEDAIRADLTEALERLRG